MYAQLSDSYQWNLLNKNDTISNFIADIMKNGRRLTLQDIPSAMLQIKNRIKSPLTPKLIQSIEDGSIILMYAQNVKVPVYLPFLVMQSGPHSYTGLVLINNLDAVNGDVEITLNARKLKVSLESCYIAMKFFELGNNPKLRSSSIIRIGSKIYSSIFTECVNRKHSIKLDTNVYNALLYMSSKYFVRTMIGCTDSISDETIQNYCLYNCKNADIIFIKHVESQFTSDDFKNISTFISKLINVHELQHRLKRMTVSNYIEAYINMYDASMILAMEVFSYLVYNILSVNEATYVNNYQVLKNIVGDDGRKLYADLIVSVCNL